METIERLSKTTLGKSGIALLVILSLYFGIKFLSEVKAYGRVGEVNTITLSGYGEVFAVPDLATVYFTIEKEAKTVKEAQDAVAKIEASALEALKANGVEDKDIKTSNASFSPVYEYQYGRAVLCNEFGCPPRPGKNVITGYSASESITVKVRNVDNVGKIMQDLGTLGVSELNGPNFTVEDEDALKAEARKLAIDEARAKATVLAKDLGVRLGKVVNFSESGDYPMPLMYAKAMDMAGGAESAPAQLPRGENVIGSNVTITFEIR